MLAATSAGARQVDRNDFDRLKDDVARLNTQQQQILTSLDELKKMMRGPVPPELKRALQRRVNCEGGAD